MESTPLWLLILALIICLICSAFFSASETAMMSLNRYKLKHLEEEGNIQAKKTSALLARPDRLIGTILLGNNFVNIFATSIGTVIGIRLFGDLGVLISTIFLTVTILIFAEVAPKTIAVVRSQQIALPASVVLSFLVKALFPLVSLLNVAVLAILRPFGVQMVHHQEEAMTSEELKTIVLASSAQAPERREMLMGVLELEDITVEEAMVNRNELEGVDLNDDWAEMLKQISQSQHGRLVAYRDNLDHVEGLLHIRDIISLLHEQKLTREALLKVLRPCVYVPDSTPLRQQLLNFQKQKIRSALVVDEYGDLKGLITLEDILTHIVGDMEDNEPAYTQQQEALYTVEGSTPLRQLNRELGLKFPLDTANTLSGFIIERLGNFPEIGVQIECEDCLLRVLDFADGVVGSVELRLISSEADEQH